MKIITKQKDEQIKNFNIFKVMFLKYKDEKVIEELPKSIPVQKNKATPKPILMGKIDEAYSKRNYNGEYSKEFVEKQFNSMDIGSRFTVEGRVYVVNKIPNIDYSRTYLPFFLLVKNEFLKVY